MLTEIENPDWALAHFTLVADLTTLRAECRFARAGETVVARYLGLPFAALAFWGNDPSQLTSLAAQLVAPAESFYLLLNEQQRALAAQIFEVEQVRPEWQMLFTGDAAALDPGAAQPLAAENLAQMHTLAENAGLMALETNPFRHGPAFGAWRGNRLVAMAATHLLLPSAAEIGNIATHSDHRRQGLARQVIAALVRAHTAAGRRVFLMVFQSNRPAARLYEELGFRRLRPMFLLRCRRNE